VLCITCSVIIVPYIADVFLIPDIEGSTCSSYVVLWTVISVCIYLQKKKDDKYENAGIYKLKCIDRYTA
jgi:hypothetical protein